jgi:hypothetical protein
MRKGLLILLTASLVLACLPSAAQARKHHRHKPAGIVGVVLNTTCNGACAEPPPPAPLYTGAGLTVTVTRISDAAVMTSSQPIDGGFRYRLPRGHYQLSAAINELTPQPLVQGRFVMPTNCWMGDSKEATVRRHHFTYVELRVGNVCIV